MEEQEKKALYKRIAAVPDEMLLERMRAYGYWASGVPIPEDPTDEATERKRIEAQIDKLRKQHATVKDPDKALAEERKRRWDESKKRRALRKAEREAKKKQRHDEWEAFRLKSLVHAGQGVSATLQDKTSNTESLTKRGLPILHNADDLAAMLAVPLATLRWLTFHRRGATLVHYHRFEIPKKTGGRRLISAPKTALAGAQRKILDNILARLAIESEAHGFVPGRSILTNARLHAARQVVVNLDLADFFPSISFARVRGLFAHLGYSGQVATLLALLCTEPPRVATEYDGRIFHVALGERVLPQGACTSPAVTNAICRRIDRRLAGLAKKHGFVYTRYADDLTLSGDQPKKVGRLLRSVRTILADEGFTENVSKTRVMRQSRRQEVTGLSVNTRPAVSRKERRRLRAILHNAAKNGLESQNRDGHPSFAAHLRGKVAYACMVDPDRRSELVEALSKALAES
ncbi:reverse transcriptase domain-containing protein [Myxococcota bacterium]